MQAIKPIPVAKGYPILGVYPKFKQDPIAFIETTAKDLGPVVRMPMAGFPFVLVSHPDAVAAIMERDMKYYAKSKSAKRAAPLIGDGLLLSEGDKWRRNRRLVSPAFHPRKLAHMMPALECLVRSRLQEAYDDHKGIPDVVGFMSRLTLDMFCQAFLGGASQHTSAMVEAFNIAMQGITDRSMSGFATPLWLPTAQNRRLNKQVQRVHAIIADIVAERRDSSPDGDDLLSALLAVRDDQGPLSAAAIRDELVTFFLAGHETTAMGLSWLMLFLLRHPEVTATLQAEVTKTITSELTTTSLRSLNYTQMVIKESLRLAPPVWMFRRQSKVDQRLLDYGVKRGDIMMLSPYLVHRHAEFWQRPLEFDPLRMEPTKIAQQHAYAYFPFGGGKRLCIGMNFAMMEMALVVVTLLRQYTIAYQPDLRVQPASSLTLRPSRTFQLALRSQRI